MLSERVRRRTAAILAAAPVLLAGAEALAQPKAAPPPTTASAPAGAPAAPAAPKTATPSGPAAPKAAVAPDANAAEKQQVARVKGEQGLKLFGAGRWSEAYEWFREANVLYHAPTLVLYMARCQRRAGRLLEARILYNQVVAEPVPSDARAALVEAHDSAKTELDEIRTLIPVVQLAVTDVPRASVKLTLDGAPVTDDTKELNPGNHTVDITGGANEHNTKSFTLAEGQRIKVEIRLRNPAPLPAPKPVVVAPPPRGSIVPGAVVLGIGGASLFVGAITGLITLSKASDVKGKCTGNICPASAQGEANSANTLGNISTATFVIGGVAAAAGIVLVVTRPRFVRAGPRSAGVEWTLGAGPGRVELGGSF